MINKPPEFIRTYQVAELLGVHMNTVKRIPEKDLPYWRFGNRGDRMYAPKDVEEYVNKRYVGRQND